MASPAVKTWICYFKRENIESETVVAYVGKMLLGFVFIGYDDSTTSQQRDLPVEIRGALSIGILLVNL